MIFEPFPLIHVMSVDMILGIANMISQAVVVTFVIIGVVMILLAIRFGADYLFGDHSIVNEEKLKRDLSASDRGISRHSLFYRFFFRND